MKKFLKGQVRLRKQVEEQNTLLDHIEEGVGPKAFHSSFDDD